MWPHADPFICCPVYSESWPDTKFRHSGSWRGEYPVIVSICRQPVVICCHFLQFPVYPLLIFFSILLIYFFFVCVDFFSSKTSIYLSFPCSPKRSYNILDCRIMPFLPVFSACLGFVRECVCVGSVFLFSSYPHTKKAIIRVLQNKGHFLVFSSWLSFVSVCARVCSQFLL